MRTIKHLSGRIYQYRERWFFDNLNATEPYMEVIIRIINAAVFPIVIKGVVGSFQIQGTKCNWDTIKLGGTRIPHGEAVNIRISQRLLRETVEMMVQLNNERDGFMVDLGTCSFVVQAEEPGVENEPTKVPINIRETVRITG